MHSLTYIIVQLKTFKLENLYFKMETRNKRGSYYVYTGSPEQHYKLVISYIVQRLVSMAKNWL